MKAVAVVPAKREVNLIETEPPRLASPSQVRVRMLDVGVCGTDHEICAFRYGAPPSGCEHLIIGHESLGEVVEIGRAVSGIKPGDLVAITVRRPCRHESCLSCTADRADFCFTGDFLERGINNCHGFMTEYVVDEARNMTIVPNALRSVGVLVEPLAIAEKAIEQIWSLQLRLPWVCPHHKEKGMGHCHNAVVLGAGPVGLLGAMVLVRQGFNTYVFSRDKVPTAKAAIAESIGASYVSAQDVSIHDLMTRVGNIDVVYEATGASQLSFEALKRLGLNGIFVFTGVPGRRAAVESNTDGIVRNLVLRNQVMFACLGASRSHFQAAINDLAAFNRSWPRAVSGLITGRYPVERYRELLSGPAHGIKNVIMFAS